MLTIKRNPTVGNEAIHYQGKSSLFERLAAGLGKIRDGDIFTDDVFRKSGLPEMVFEECGFNIIFKVFKDSDPNAMVKIPSLDKNNPIISELERDQTDSIDFHTARKYTKNKFTGTLSLKECRVYGVFTKLVIPVYITTGILANKKFTNSEISAIILHEFGHIWSYFERLIDTASMNYAAVSAAERIFGLEKDELKIELLYDLDKDLDIKLTDKETIAKYKNKEAIYFHIVSDTVKQRRNEEGDLMYSHRGYEYSSDQFAVRHGAGADLVSALDKLHTTGWFYWYWRPAYRPWILHITIEIFTVFLVYLFTKGLCGMILFGHPVNKVRGVWALITMLIALVSYNPMEKHYDDPEGRMRRIRNDMIGELKNKNINKERRSVLLADLEAIEEIISTIEDKRSVLEIIRAYLIPPGIRDRNKMEYQQKLELLGNNELFVSSSKLANI